MIIYTFKFHNVDSKICHFFCNKKKAMKSTKNYIRLLY